ncbi:alpha/beta hydrolase [Streptacidiphilus carbonis]|uniref:alpha/beta hydrolase n=1 Tax=Streptacidiphilus carbonis TaxID=105422 RepID=UPI00137813A5|nr:alpha/beta hydrolase-fold protein [Streptacidiphilus carbonis]
MTTIVLALVLTLLALTAWNRLPGPKPVRVGARLLMLAATQGAAVLVVLVLVNNSYAFYDSWSDLVGTQAGAATFESVGVGVRQSSLSAATATPATFRTGSQGLQVSEPVGPRSHIRGQLLVWLPPEYDEPAHAGERFPVVVLLPGQPGTPMSWFDAMNGQDELARLVEAHQARPMILVAAKSNTLGTDDAGCTDLPKGPKTDTWLAEDVPAIVKSRFRVSNDPYDWSVMGYSAGGYCAANLAVHHPDVFHSAVSISGYNMPEATVVLAHPALTKANNPLLVLRRAARQPDIALLLTGSLQDGSTVQDARALVGALRAPATGDVATVQRGGHNMDVWQEMLPTAFQWISRHLR